MLTFIIGGARSGKSRFAESLCPPSHRVAYIATARVQDKEMQARVARHRKDRPTHWMTFEEPLAIDVTLRYAEQFCQVLLVDCLTIWLSNLLYQNRRFSAPRIEGLALEQIDNIIKAATSWHVILVSNEVGGGIVPSTKIGRLFRDLQGRVNQHVAAKADQVFLVVAGIPIQIKPPLSFPTTSGDTQIRMASGTSDQFRERVKR